MTVASALSSPSNLKDKANYPDLNEVSDILKALALGDLLLGQMVQVRRAVDMTAQAVNPYNLSTVQVVTMAASTLPPASFLMRATARAGGVTGELTIDGYAAAAPVTGHVSIAPNGSIATLATDAITNLDLVYAAERGLVVELTLPVNGSGVLTLPASILSGAGGNGVVLLLEAEAFAATVPGKKIVLIPGTAPATTQARLSVAKNTVLFNTGTDVVTRARVKVFVAMPSGDGLIGSMTVAAISP